MTCLGTTCPLASFLDPTSPAAVEQLVPGNPAQPRDRRVLLRPVARSAAQRGGEHLGCEVGRGVSASGRIAAESDDGAKMPAVERRKRFRVATGTRRQELRIIHYLNNRSTPSLVTRIVYATLSGRRGRVTERS